MIWLNLENSHNISLMHLLRRGLLNMWSPFATSLFCGQFEIKIISLYLSAHLILTSSLFSYTDSGCPLPVEVILFLLHRLSLWIDHLFCCFLSMIWYFSSDLFKKKITVKIILLTYWTCSFPQEKTGSTTPMTMLSIVVHLSLEISLNASSVVALESYKWVI